MSLVPAIRSEKMPKVPPPSSRVVFAVAQKDVHPAPLRFKTQPWLFHRPIEILSKHLVYLGWSSNGQSSFESRLEVDYALRNLPDPLGYVDVSAAGFVCRYMVAAAISTFPESQGPEICTPVPLFYTALAICKLSKIRIIMHTRWHVFVFCLDYDIPPSPFSKNGKTAAREVEEWSTCESGKEGSNIPRAWSIHPVWFWFLIRSRQRVVTKQIRQDAEHCTPTMIAARTVRMQPAKSSKAWLIMFRPWAIETVWNQQLLYPALCPQIHWWCRTSWNFGQTKVCPYTPYTIHNSQVQLRDRGQQCPTM